MRQNFVFLFVSNPRIFLFEMCIPSHLYSDVLLLPRFNALTTAHATHFNLTGIAAETVKT